MFEHADRYYWNMEKWTETKNAPYTCTVLLCLPFHISIIQMGLQPHCPHTHKYSGVTVFKNCSALLGTGGTRLPPPPMSDTHCHSALPALLQNMLEYYSNSCEHAKKKMQSIPIAETADRLKLSRYANHVRERVRSSKRRNNWYIAHYAKKEVPLLFCIMGYNMPPFCITYTSFLRSGHVREPDLHSEIVGGCLLIRRSVYFSVSS